jgi:hypothetical protein
MGAGSTEGRGGSLTECAKTREGLAAVYTESPEGSSSKPAVHKSVRAKSAHSTLFGARKKTVNPTVRPIFYLASRLRLVLSRSQHKLIDQQRIRALR